MVEQEPIKKTFYCKKCVGKFSCESTVIKQDDDTYAYDDTRRFQFIYEDGAINDRIIATGSIDDCEIRKQQTVNQPNNQNLLKNTHTKNQEIKKQPKTVDYEIYAREVKKEKVKTRVIYNFNEPIIEAKIINIKEHKKHKKSKQPYMIKMKPNFNYSRIAR